ncbi:hypothetical protein M5K25_011752 [Dendrobium thyrsiflorum]|uniref:Uncharacterized protein n=1 Tax=Dendrobium thyrsiflorum TaxID=117978 RepID=A0ABD0VAI1_DENTH
MVRSVLREGEQRDEFREETRVTEVAADKKLSMYLMYPANSSFSAHAAGAIDASPGSSFAKSPLQDFFLR